MSTERIEPIIDKFYKKYPNFGTIGFIDLETTGFEKTARLIEIGMIVVVPGFEKNEFYEFETLINPGVEIRDKITEVTGITNAELKDAPGEDEAYMKFINWYKKFNPNKLVAHNASFDRGKLQNNLLRLGYDLGNCLPDFICTMQLSRRYNKEVANDQLKTIAEYYGFKNLQAHRALADTETCAYAFGRLMTENDYVS
jgi:DNA polymerase-3 subunit alpha (Gram-positive type)